MSRTTTSGADKCDQLVSYYKFSDRHRRCSTGYGIVVLFCPVLVVANATIPRPKNEQITHLPAVREVRCPRTTQAFPVVTGLRMSRLTRTAAEDVQEQIHVHDCRSALPNIAMERKPSSAVCSNRSRGRRKQNPGAAKTALLGQCAPDAASSTTAPWSETNLIFFQLFFSMDSLFLVAMQYFCSAVCFRVLLPQPAARMLCSLICIVPLGARALSHFSCCT